MICSDDFVRGVAHLVSSAVWHHLHKSYESIDGVWWLFVDGKPQRALRRKEVAWHVTRGHAPFVTGGVKPESLAWWEEE